MPASRSNRAGSSSRRGARRLRDPSPERQTTRVKFSRVKKLRVGVIYGGRSGEHEVSLASAAAVFQNLDPERYLPVAILIEKDGRWALPTRPPAITVAADVIQGAKKELREATREAHLVAHPGGDTLLTVDRRDSGAVVAGLGLDVV